MSDLGGARMVVANPAANATVDRLIVVHTIGIADLRDALAKGCGDFQAMPTFRLISHHRFQISS